MDEETVNKCGKGRGREKQNRNRSRKENMIGRFGIGTTYSFKNAILNLREREGRKHAIGSREMQWAQQVLG
jgi:hypothetical protein